MEGIGVRPVNKVVESVDAFTEEEYVSQSKLYKEFTSIATIDKAWTFKSPSGHGSRTMFLMSQPNLLANKKQKLILSSVISEDSDGGLNVEWAPFPTEVTGASLIMPSPSGSKLLVVRNPENDLATQLEIWGPFQLEKEIRVPQSVHGSVYADGWFEGVSWSPDESHIAYVAEEPDVHKPTFNDMGYKKDGGSNLTHKDCSSWKGQGDWEEDWGEAYAGKRPPALFVVNINSGDVRAVDGIGRSLSVGQVVWAPITKGLHQYLVFVGWPSDTRRLGMKYCSNRPCALYVVRAPSIGSETRENTADDVSVIKLSQDIGSAFLPRFTQDGKLLVFLSAKSAVDSGAHNATNSLHKIDWNSDGEPNPGKIIDVATGGHLSSYGSRCPVAWSNIRSFRFRGGNRQPLDCPVYFAAVVWKLGGPVVLEEIRVDPPKASEVRIKMLCASICHTDVLCTKGFPIPLFPRIPGHEGVGVIESVGKDAKGLKPGDIVMPLYLGECGQCLNCKTGKTNLCHVYPPPFSGLMSDGTSRMSIARTGESIYHFTSCSTWTEYAVADCNYVLKINPKISYPHASFLSCGFTTGFGATWRETQVSKGSSVAVFGIGTVGLGVIKGAQLQGASKIIGVDVNQYKAAKGKVFGMTDFINPKDHPDKSVSELVKELTHGLGVDHCFECTGVPSLLNEALEASKFGIGTVVPIGAGGEASVAINSLILFSGRTLKCTTFGGVRTQSDLPVIIDKCLNKEIQLDELLTHEIHLDNIQEAFEILKKPDCVKILINF